MEFEWDDEKARTNLIKHEVRFTEAVTVWLDENALEMPDPEHSDDEERWLRIGMSQKLRILIVVFVEKCSGEVTRVISARKAVGNEQKEYLSRLEKV